MPRAKRKQEQIDRRDLTYGVLDVHVCLNCRFYWNRFGNGQCQPDHLRHTAGDISQRRDVEPLGTCDLWEAKGN